jgi:hypothetical protein
LVFLFLFSTCILIFAGETQQLMALSNELRKRYQEESRLAYEGGAALESNILMKMQRMSGAKIGGETYLFVSVPFWTMWLFFLFCASILLTLCLNCFFGVQVTCTTKLAPPLGPYTWWKRTRAPLSAI